MTVHGAKGLEASVVFLVDTTTSPSDTQRLRLIHLPQGNADPHAPGGRGVGRQERPRIPGRRRRRAQAMIGDTEDEYRRLLYVAMTRAADRLIVGGCMPGNMNTVRKLLLVRSDHQGPRRRRARARGDRDAARHGDALFARPDDVAAARHAALTAAALADRAAVNWLRAPGAARDRRRRPAAPVRSRRCRRPPDTDRRIGAAARPRPAARHAGASPAAIAARHRRRAPARRRARLSGPQRRWLERGGAARRWPTRCAGPDRATRASRRCSPPAAAPRSRSSGRLERPGQPKALVSGQIDRLVVTPNEVLIVDFKTNHAPPKAAAEAPRGYVRPARAVPGGARASFIPSGRSAPRCFGPKPLNIMEISAPALDAELASIISA